MAGCRFTFNLALVATPVHNPRHPERTLLYRIVVAHVETWLELASAGQFDGQDTQKKTAESTAP